MPTAITPVSSFHPARVPANGETRNNASYVMSLQDLTNRSVYLESQMDALVTQFNGLLRLACYQDTFVRNGTWKRPADYQFGGFMMVTLIGAGGGGGAGNTRATRNSGFKCPGKGGHAGARQTFFLFSVPETAAIELGVGGAGGTAGSLVGHPGNAGSDGGRTSFTISDINMVLSASGGAGGAGGHYNDLYYPVPAAALITRVSARGGFAREHTEVYDGDSGIYPGGLVGTGGSNMPGGGGAGGWHLSALSAPVLDRIKEMLESGERTSASADVVSQSELVATAAKQVSSGKATVASAAANKATGLLQEVRETH